MAGLNSRWKKGNPRYADKQRKELDKWREPAGWRNGAKISRLKPQEK
jgi:hypothetical protein